MECPSRSEYAEYYHRYIERVPDGDIVGILEAQRDEFVSRLRSISEERGDHRYADGKWTVKEVVGHVTDAERIFGYRTLAFGRGDKTPLPAFEHDDYVARANFAERTIADLADEFESLRTALVVLLRSFDDEVWMRRGTASGFEFTTRAVAWIIAGHVMHHAAVLEECYL
jgi:hypothetical protein